jgi:hypothetical protein
MSMRQEVTLALGPVLGYEYPDGMKAESRTHSATVQTYR